MHGVSHQEATTLVVPLAAGTPALYLYILVFITARSDYVTPILSISKKEATRLVVPFAAGCQSYLSSCMAPLVQWGTHLWACKTHQMKEVGYDGINQIIHPGGCKILHLHTHTRKHTRGNAVMAFSLSLQFGVCGCVLLPSGERERAKRGQ